MKIIRSVTITRRRRESKSVFINESVSLLIIESNILKKRELLCVKNLLVSIFIYSKSLSLLL